MVIVRKTGHVLANDYDQMIVKALEATQNKMDYRSSREASLEKCRSKFDSQLKIELQDSSKIIDCQVPKIVRSGEAVGVLGEASQGKRNAVERLKTLRVRGVKSLTRGRQRMLLVVHFDTSLIMVGALVCYEFFIELDFRKLSFSPSLSFYLPYPV